ncbi:MAG: hypothetical protein QW194_04205 [Candidatus Micrarchaeaceae archaeon]
MVPGKWTVKDVLSVVREMTKTVEQRKVLSEQGKYLYNLAISEVVALLNGALDPAYFYSEIITLGSDILLDASANISYGSVEVINATEDTIQRVSGSTQWQVGQLIVVSTWANNGNPISHWVGRIVAKDQSGYIGKYQVLAGSDVTFNYVSDGFANVTVFQTLSVLSFDITSLSKPLDRIVAIIDSVYGECVEVKPSEFYSINRSDFSHKSYDDDIIYTRIGNKLYFRNGSRVTNPGIKTIIYQRQPDYPVNYDDTEYADIANKFVPLLAKRLYTYILLQLETGDVPKNLHEEMVMDYQSIMNYASSELQNKKQKEQG